MKTMSAPPARTTAARLAWPLDAHETRLPAKPMWRRDSPLVIWRGLLRRTWWRLHRDLRPSPVQRPVWC
jgi:hypothetical protein